MSPSLLTPSDWRRLASRLLSAAGDDQRSVQDRGYHRRGPWKNVDEVEYGTLEWVEGCNHRCSSEPIADMSSADMEVTRYRRKKESVKVA